MNENALRRPPGPAHGAIHQPRTAERARVGLRMPLMERPGESHTQFQELSTALCKPRKQIPTPRERRE